MIELTSWITLLILLGGATAVGILYVAIRCLITGQLVQVSISWGRDRDDFDE